MYRSFGKRIFDILLSLVGILVLSPIFLLLILLIKLDSSGPVFFKQRRMGRHKQEFNILKFRTMKVDTPSNTPTHLLENPDLYITKLGRLLRKSSLDELPQLINILMGEMSVVGPRPALWNQYDLIAERDKYGANDIRPGLTGWAQVNGRDEISLVQKACFDGSYCNNTTLKFDIKILLITIINIVKSEGVKEGV
ncbi:UDP-phosphate galactose phosphotransferase [Paenibacillus sp. J31TS4]|uniref:sugar transferase n=1 Tax=Paenibacillus sp. J31TS4 TaxID=2807195 RepID=UPI001B21CCE8|nr:sugar transferase [Paenibacillus sp. J31TS4]GIP39900.1 UDP-phosphate galactose phosphotransferase [Paenibacillus sp. J31TS4]